MKKRIISVAFEHEGSQREAYHVSSELKDTVLDMLSKRKTTMESYALAKASVVTHLDNVKKK